MSAKFSANRAGVRQICLRLRRVHGAVERWTPAPVLDELVAAVLSQNTSDTNSGRAFAELRQSFPDWDAVRRAPVSRIAQAIRPAGLSNRKAPRIKAILQQIHQEHGQLSLDFLRDWTADAAWEYLRAFPGVGPKTAACVLLFACELPILPVDTHVHRVSLRLGLIGPRTNAERAQVELASLVPATLVLDFHILLIRHGRTTCKASQPRCLDCVLLDACPAGRAGLEAGQLQHE